MRGVGKRKGGRGRGEEGGGEEGGQSSEVVCMPFYRWARGEGWGVELGVWCGVVWAVWVERATGGTGGVCAGPLADGTGGGVGGRGGECAGPLADGTGGGVGGRGGECAGPLADGIAGCPSTSPHHHPHPPRNTHRAALDERDVRSIITMAAQIAWEADRRYTPAVPVPVVVMAEGAAPAAAAAAANN